MGATLWDRVPIYTLEENRGTIDKYLSPSDLNRGRGDLAGGEKHKKKGQQNPHPELTLACKNTAGRGRTTSLRRNFGRVMLGRRDGDWGGGQALQEGRGTTTAVGRVRESVGCGGVCHSPTSTCRKGLGRGIDALPTGFRGGARTEVRIITIRGEVRVGVRVGVQFESGCSAIGVEGRSGSLEMGSPDISPPGAGHGETATGKKKQ
mmetsp:Transcript_21352/g.45657  ORF Transcript_21352/g.45657 Transcript_21352/m.45657 type:complete len:206 (-) Transcript_21352:20-637(-)